MKGPAISGLVLVLAGAVVLLVTPSHTVWGNHHYVRHIFGWIFIACGALFLVTGLRR